jgi:hypothetical protein
MGWDSSSAWKTKSDVILELVRDFKASTSYELVAYSSSTEGLWAVLKERSTGKLGIAFYAIDKQGKDYFVKGMGEGCGPYYYSCPKKFLDMVPEDNAFEYNAKWRAQWAAARSGDRARLLALVNDGQSADTF